MKTTGLLASALILAPALYSQAPCSDQVHSLERQLTEQNHLIRDWGGLIRYGSDNSELPPPSKGQNRIIFFGDQLAESWSLSRELWLNRGIAGQTTDQMLVRFRQDVISLHPKAVVILAGLNDIAGLHGAHTEEMILDNLASMSELAQAHGIRVILASVPPSRRQWQERISELNALITEYCSRTGATYLDLSNTTAYSAMLPLAEKAISEALAK
jgi:acyl-CoA thioesterase-1